MLEETVRRKRRSASSIASALVALTLATPCRANVFAVSDDGALTPVSGASSAIVLAASYAAPSPDILARSATPPVSVPIPSAFAQLTMRAAEANGLSTDLLSAVVWQESAWRSRATSRAGAIGLAQLMPATADSLRIDARDPASNLYGAAHYLRDQMNRFGGNLELALAAYNAGPGRVRRAGGIPAIAETRNYVTAVMDRLSIMPDKGN